MATRDDVRLDLVARALAGRAAALDISEAPSAARRPVIVTRTSPRRRHALRVGDRGPPVALLRVPHFPLASERAAASSNE